MSLNWFLAVVGMVLIAAGIPADGLTGITLSLIGMTLSVIMIVRVRRAAKAGGDQR